MADDYEIISTYSLEQALKDDILIKLFDVKWLGKISPVVVTAHLHSESSLEELLEIWGEFVKWRSAVVQTLPEVERMYVSKLSNGKKVWVDDDGSVYTLMYPEDY